jgi:hypothetical protein
MSDVFEMLNLDLDSDLIESLSPAEKEAILNILNEIGTDGTSKSYNELLDKDYDEIPVDIDTFLEDNRYIGKTTKNGTTIYPYWRRTLRKIFAEDSQYNEIIFSGAIGLGKTTLAVIGMAYILYRLLCLKNPQEFYGLQSNSEIVIAFFNVNLDLSHGVAYKKMQSMLMESPWFLEHGSVHGRDENTKHYIPDKGISFTVGSQDTHSLGQDIFCITGDTVISTVIGDMRIEDIPEGSIIHVYSEDNRNIVESNECTVKKMGEVTELYHLTLEDGTVLKFTGDHRLKLTDGTYKKVSELTVNDDIVEVERKD